MLFTNARCRSLALEYVNAASGLDLRQFRVVGRMARRTRCNASVSAHSK